MILTPVEWEVPPFFSASAELLMRLAQSARAQKNSGTQCTRQGLEPRQVATFRGSCCAPQIVLRQLAVTLCQCKSARGLIRLGLHVDPTIEGLHLGQRSIEQLRGRFQVTALHERSGEMHVGSSAQTAVDSEIFLRQ